MNLRTRILLSASAVIMGVLGLGITFLPHELLAHLDVPSNAAIVLLMQLLGALYLGMALLDWFHRGSHIGGIYARPLALANFMAYAVGAIALLKAVIGQSMGLDFVMLTLAYVAFAVWFGLVLFTTPLKVQP